MQVGQQTIIAATIFIVSGARGCSEINLQNI
jgi:hypothetical protein